MLFLQALILLSLSITSVAVAGASSYFDGSKHGTHGAAQEELDSPSISYAAIKTAAAIPDDMHARQNNSNYLIDHSDHEKRALGRSYAVRVCPAGTNFYQSKCFGIREYSIRCTNQTTVLLLRGNCFPEEICADTYSHMDSSLPHFDPWRMEAYCIGYDEFAKFAKSELGADNHIPAARVLLPRDGRGAWQYALEAIYTGPDDDSTVKAEKMTLRTMRTRNVHGHVLDVPLRGGSKECSNCDRILVDPVPDGTTHVSLDVVGKAGAIVENIRMGSWIP